MYQLNTVPKHSIHDVYLATLCIASLKLLIFIHLYYIRSSLPSLLFGKLIEVCHEMAL